MDKACINSGRGFSLIELLLVIAILAILSSGVVIWFLGYQRQAEVDSASRSIVETMRNAQARTVSGKDFKNWGVCFSETENKFALFRQDCNKNGIMDNGETGIDCGGGGCFDCDLKCNGALVKEENYLSSFVKIGSITLNAGGNQLIFNKPNGDTVQYGTIRISEKINANNYKDITISPAGKVDSQ